MQNIYGVPFKKFKVTLMWFSCDSSRSNQWHHPISPSKPHNFCLKHFSWFKWNMTEATYKKDYKIYIQMNRSSKVEEISCNEAYNSKMHRFWIQLQAGAGLLSPKGRYFFFLRTKGRYFEVPHIWNLERERNGEKGRSDLRSYYI